MDACCEIFEGTPVPNWNGNVIERGEFPFCHRILVPKRLLGESSASIHQFFCVFFLMDGTNDRPTVYPSVDKGNIPSFKL